MRLAWNAMWTIKTVVDPEGWLFCGFIQFFPNLFLNLILFSIINGFQNIWEETPLLQTLAVQPLAHSCSATTALGFFHSHTSLSQMHEHHTMLWCTVSMWQDVGLFYGVRGFALRKRKWMLLHRTPAEFHVLAHWRVFVTCGCNVRNRCSSEAVSVEVWQSKAFIV